jgi:hypothetical protein
MLLSNVLLWRTRTRIGFHTAALPKIALSLMIAILSAGSALAATTHYIAASGSDSNNGTSTSTPWMHAPGMPNCSGSCSSYTPQPGDQFIFRGGDTWHFGNSSASPYTGGMWSWTGSGTSGNPIYVGVEQTWYSGSSWTRPILTGDNAPTPNPGKWGDYVASCAYQIGPNNNMVSPNASNLTFDNFELTGLCQDDLASSSVKNIYMLTAGGNSSVTYKNLYIHGWTHLQFNCTAGSPPSGHCFEIMAFYGGSGSGAPITLNTVVVDGSDSDPGGAAQFYVSANNILNSVFRYVATGSTTNCHVVANTLWDYIFSPSDNEAHGDTLLCISETSGINAYYNFLIRNNYSNGVTQPIFWIGPTSGSTDYVFNDVWYANNITGEGFNIQNEGGGPVYAFNNTMQQSSGGLMDCGGGSQTHSINNHFITDSASAFYGNGTCATASNVTMTNATATANAYTSSQTYSYSPTLASSPTVGGGANEQSFCSAMLGSSDPLVQAAGTACQSDTEYACDYNSSNHTVSCPTRTVVARPPSGSCGTQGAPSCWNVGAYEYNAQTGAPNPPTGLSAVVN